jgi:hypothetical protein
VFTPRIAVALLGVLLVGRQLQTEQRLGELEQQLARGDDLAGAQGQDGAAPAAAAQPRQLQEDGPSACGDLRARVDRVTAECCDEPSEDCSAGVPSGCNPGCAALFLPFWSDCETTMGGSKFKGSQPFEPLVALCEAAAGAPDPAAGTAVGASGNANAFPFAAGETSLYVRYARRTAFDYYPLPNTNDFHMAGEWMDRQQSELRKTGSPAGAMWAQYGSHNIDAQTSLSAAHYYNAVVYILLRYFNFSPPTDVTQPWSAPAEAQICQPPMAGCGEEDTATERMQADFRIRPTICCHGTGHLDFSALLNEYTSDVKPCAFANTNSVTMDLYLIATSQYSSTTLYQVSYHNQTVFF